MKMNTSAGARAQHFIAAIPAEGRLRSPPRLVHVALHAMVDGASDAQIHSADLLVPAAWPTALPLNHPEGVVGPAKAIQDLAGRQSIAVTNRYMHLAPGALRTAIDLLEPLQASSNDVPKLA